MTSSGYYQQPTIHDDRVVYVSEDDLWEVPLAGGESRRLTSGLGKASHPFYSPDGSKIAFTATEEGAPEIHVIDAFGSQPRQLTFLGTRCETIGWSPDGEKILFWSMHRQAFGRDAVVFAVPIEGGEPEVYGVGRARAITHEPGGDGMAIARNANDLSRWKRYRGGTAATIWLTRDGESWTHLFADQQAGITRPMWVGERLYVLSDFEGYANLYESDLDGQSLERVTHHEDFYVRFPQTDCHTIVYEQGADLWALEPGGEPRKIEIRHASPRTQLKRKFVDAEDYVYSYGLHPDGHSMALTSRGKLFNFGFWEGGVRQNGVEQGVRYDHPTYLDSDRMLVVSDASGEPRFEIHRADGSAEPELVEWGDDLGRPTEVKLAPDGKRVAFTNDRNELIFAGLESGEVKMIDRSKLRPIDGFDWSSDSRWIAYSVAESDQTATIRIYEVESGEIRDVTSGDFKDVDPVFDPAGRYLYFLSYRFFEPVYDQLFFEISFPQSMKPCVVTLRDDVDSPFFEKPRSLDASGDSNSDEDDSDESSGDADGSDAKDSEDSDDSADVDPVEIDFDGITGRIEAFSTPTGIYGQIGATEDRVFWSQFWLTEGHGAERNGASGKIRYYNLKDYETKTFATGVDEFFIGPDGKTMALWGDELRIVSASASNVDDDDDDRPSRSSGIIDLDRIRVEVDVRAEWRQMLREAWRLMRDHYWNAELAGIDWQAVYERYAPQVERVGSRSEFSDLVWRMQGEMGTSHAYEMGGDYRTPPQYRPGFLGADVSWNGRGYRIDHIVRGDTWKKRHAPPLARPGLDVRQGDVIVAINGRSVDQKTSVQERLVAQAGNEVELTLERDGERKSVTVKTARSEMALRYREWVESNRRRVHDATDGKVGYVHIPDMSVRGFAEFHRGYLTEARRTGLVVDVRKNGGGHVSQLILEKLARTRIGYDITRFGGVFPYPSDSILGPIVALTDEHAGSDGDIFSHCFKLMEIGPLIGKRTWGGVVGIWPRQRLADGSVTTQPEYSFWFEDVGFGVENYGTDPDIEVELDPGAWARGEDPQLERAIEEALKRIDEEKPAVPDFGEIPILRPPESLD